MKKEMEWIMHKNSRNRLPDGWRDSYDNGWGQSGYKNPDLNPQNSEPQDYGFSANTSTNNGYYDGYTNDLSNQNSGYTNQYMNDYSNSFEENPYSNPYESGYQPNFEAGYTQNYGESDMNNSGSLMPVSLYGGYEQPEQRFTDYTQEHESGFYQSNAKPKYKKIALGALCAVLAAGVFIGGGFALNHFGVFAKDASFISVCESSIPYNKGIGVTFYVGPDGKTIEVLEDHATVTLDFLENNLKTDKPKEVLAEYKKTVKDSFNATKSKYDSYDWFHADLSETDSSIQTVYSIDVGSETFTYEEAKPALEELNLTYYYNEEEKAFIYDESTLLTSGTPVGIIDSVECSKTTIEKKDIDEYRNKLKGETAKSDSETESSKDTEENKTE